jgi:hypothetical protein
LGRSVSGESLDKHGFGTPGVKSRGTESCSFHPFSRDRAERPDPRTTSVSHVSRRAQARQGRTLSVKRRACPCDQKWRRGCPVEGVPPSHREVDLHYASSPVQGNSCSCQRGARRPAAPPGIGNTRGWRCRRAALQLSGAGDGERRAAAVPLAASSRSWHLGNSPGLRDSAGLLRAPPTLVDSGQSDGGEAAADSACFSGES